MPCYHPLIGYRLDGGSIHFGSHRRGGEEVRLPCGQCIGCRLERSRQWAARIMFECQLHAGSSFITLTYDDEHCPFPPSLDYSDFQRFLKRLRKRVGKVRFFAVGEYGDQYGRPHFHAIIFGEDFSSDRVLWSRRRVGSVYRSATLEACWPFGFAGVCDVTFESAAYVARYNLKKWTGDLARAHYAFVDVDTGEVSQRVPEMCRMSLKPGIGAGYFDKYRDDITVHDYVVVNGVRCKPPRYFDKLFSRWSVDDFELVKSERVAGPRDYYNESPERLAVREAVHRAAIRTLSRGDL